MNSNPNPAAKVAAPTSGIVMMDLADLKPYWRNPRKNGEAIGFVAESIRRYGFQVPIVVDQENVIISGHTRYGASMQLGLKTVPVIKLSLDPAKARQFRIADNKLAETSEWNYDKLVDELSGLKNADELADAFETQEWKDILSELKESGEGEASGDETPPPAPPVSASPPAQTAAIRYEVLCPHCGKHNVVVNI